VFLRGPNQLDTTWEHDEFGRPVKEARADDTSSHTAYCYINGRVPGYNIGESNSAECASHATAPGEVPPNAVMYHHGESRKGTTKISAYSRVYFDAAGRKIRSLTQAYDGADQPGGMGRVIVQDTDYSVLGAVLVSTQPYFLDSGTSTSTGPGYGDTAGHYGMSLTEYDVLGRAVAVYTTDPQVPGQVGGSQASVSFGAARGSFRASKGRVVYAALTTTSYDDKGRTRVEERTPEGKVVRTTDHEGGQIVHQHDAMGNLRVTRDPLGNEVRVHYDLRGRKILMSDPDAGIQVYCYDALGQLKAQQSSAMRGSHARAACPSFDGAATTLPTTFGTWTLYAYDKLGRMTVRLSPEYKSEWAYDNCATGKCVGKLTASSTNHGLSRQMVYDDLGRPVSSRTNTSSSATGTVAGPSVASAVAYDPDTGRVASQTYPTGVKVNYSYTPNGHLQAVANANALVMAPKPRPPGGTASAAGTVAAGTNLWRALSVNAFGRVERHQVHGLAGIQSAAIVQAQTGRLLKLAAGLGLNADASGNAGVVDQRLSWNSDGQLNHRVDALAGGGGVEVQDTYQYDELGRLREYTMAGGVAGAPAIRSVALQYNAVGMLLYNSDVGNYSYPVQGLANGNPTGSVAPHALQTISGGTLGSRAYGYTLNGNVESASAGKWASVAYTSFNVPDSSTGLQGPGGSPKYVWKYDENQVRVIEERTNAAGTRRTWNFHPDNSGGLGFEHELAPNGTTRSNRHYISAGGATVAVLVTEGALPDLGTELKPPVLSDTATVPAVKLEYWHKDHLGSLIATTDHNGVVTQRYSYDPFGKRRQLTGQYDPFGTLVFDWTTDTNQGTDRGYTGHEHLDDVGIVHMNGRLFDPSIGRFMQADPLIQDPGNLQNYDRYAYCYNNPTSCTDPSGYKSFRQWFAAIDDFRRDPRTSTFHNMVRSTPGQAGIDSYLMTHPWAYALVKIVASYFTFGWAGAGMDAYYTYERTGSASGAFRGFATTMATNAAFNAVGGATSNAVVSEGVTYYEAMTTGQQIANVFGHAVVGCASAAASGGNCGHGALAAGAGAIGTHVSRSALQGLQGWERVVSGTAIAAISGGVASTLGGGKFTNGATTAAMGYLFNAALHDRQAATTRAEIQGNRAAEIGCLGDYCLGAGRATNPDSIHLSITIYDSYDGITTIEGQPKLTVLDGSCLLCLNSQTTSGVKANVVWGPFGVSGPSSMGPDTFVARLRDYASSYQNWSTSYRYPSPNSNWWVSEGLRLTTGNVPNFNFGQYKAPGYGK
jgi:RHS repeat-associated protein